MVCFYVYLIELKSLFMKNYYLALLVFAFLGINQIQAQFCPPNAFATETKLIVVYDPGTLPCSQRPPTVTVESIVFTLISCSDEITVYNITPGSTLADPNNITVDFGDIICDYTGGSLSAAEFEKMFRSMLKVYPNPVSKGNSLNVELGINTNVKVKIYSVTGKEMLSTKAADLSKVSVDVSNLANGIYIAQIITDFGTINRKVIISN